MKLDASVKDSHDVVAFWMIHTNRCCADFMMLHKVGIFRTSQYIDPSKGKDIFIENIEARQVIQNWKNASGQYVLFDDNVDFLHQIMEAKSYLHITSPIRRLVDLLNQAIIFNELFPNLISQDASNFVHKWTNNIDHINSSMKSIRKLQNECSMVSYCFTHPDIMNEVHEGTIFDKNVSVDNIFIYMVYLDKLKILSQVRCNIDLQNYTKHQFKIFLFHNEERTKKKIRLALLVSS